MCLREGGDKMDDVNGSTFYGGLRRCQGEGWTMSEIEMSRHACAVSKSECPRIVWSARDICCTVSMMVFVRASALAVGLGTKCAVVIVCR
jgi:hypothetical protein